jgi:hypothetical protein
MTRMRVWLGRADPIRLRGDVRLRGCRGERGRVYHGLIGVMPCCAAAGQPVSRLRALLVNAGLLHFFSERLFATPALAGRSGTTLNDGIVASSLIGFLVLIRGFGEIRLQLILSGNGSHMDILVQPDWSFMTRLGGLLRPLGEGENGQGNRILITVNSTN